MESWHFKEFRISGFMHVSAIIITEKRRSILVTDLKKDTKGVEVDAEESPGGGGALTLPSGRVSSYTPLLCSSPPLSLS